MSVVPPEKELVILERMASEIDAEVQKAFKTVAADIRDGTPPRDAVQVAMSRFDGPYADTYRSRLSEALGRSVGDASEVMKVAGVSLSQKLYLESERLGATVAGIVDANRRGYQSARTLALELYEGYGFKPEEALTISRNSRAIPKYMKRVMTTAGIEREFSKAFAAAQVKALKTGALQAAYADLIDAIDNIESGIGSDQLDKAISVAVDERMRYYSKRIAQTELHRNYARESTAEQLNDTDIEWVQVRLSGKHNIDDICDIIAGADRYGMGPGVYPKRDVPVPGYHPFCKCNVVPRLDLTGRGGNAKYNPDAERSFLRSIPAGKRSSVAGSISKMERIERGDNAVLVHNDGIKNDEYKVIPASQV